MAMAEIYVKFDVIEDVFDITIPEDGSVDPTPPIDDIELQRFLGKEWRVSIAFSGNAVGATVSEVWQWVPFGNGQSFLSVNTDGGYSSRTWSYYAVYETFSISKPNDFDDEPLIYRSNIAPANPYQTTFDVVEWAWKDYDWEVISVPGISISDVTVSEGDVASFRVTLDLFLDEEITVYYKTVGVEAVAGKDYVPVSGSVVIAPWTLESSSLISVETIVDAVFDERIKTFFVQLTGFHVASGSMVLIVDDIGIGVIEGSKPIELNLKLLGPNSDKIVLVEGQRGGFVISSDSVNSAPIYVSVELIHPDLRSEVELISRFTLEAGRSSYEYKELKALVDEQLENTHLGRLRVTAFGLDGAPVKINDSFECDIDLVIRDRTIAGYDGESVLQRGVRTAEDILSYRAQLFEAIKVARLLDDPDKYFDSLNKASSIFGRVLAAAELAAIAEEARREYNVAVGDEVAERRVLAITTVKILDRLSEEAFTVLAGLAGKGAAGFSAGLLVGLGIVTSPVAIPVALVLGTVAGAALGGKMWEEFSPIFRESTAVWLEQNWVEPIEMKPGLRILQNSDGGRMIFSANVSDIVKGLGTKKIDHVYYDGSAVLLLAGNLENVTVLENANANLFAVARPIILNSENGASVIGNNLHNVISGNRLNNSLEGRAGDDILNGGAGNDSLIGGTGVDQMFGGAGNDTYIVDNAGDRVFETTTATSGIDAGGTDTVLSSVTFNLNAYNGVRFVEQLTLTGSGAIAGTGNALNNVIKGNAGNNTIAGLDGNDTLQGGAGADTINGGMGKDRMTGGIGADVFVFRSVTESGTTTATRDVITDFTPGIDVIDLKAIDADSTRTNNQAFSFIGDKAFTGKAGELRFANSILSADVNGDKRADFQVLLSGVSVLAETDIIL
jgi:hypothetical protein